MSLKNSVCVCGCLLYTYVLGRDIVYKFGKAQQLLVLAIIKT